MINYNFKIEFTSARTVYSDVVFTTGDMHGYRFWFEFTDHGKKVETEKFSLVIKALRSDGQIVTDSGAKTDDGKLYYDLKNSMISAPGEIKFEVALADSEGMYVTTKEITAWVREGFGDANVSAKDTAPILSTLLNASIQAAQSAEKAEKNAKVAAEEKVLELTEKIYIQDVIYEELTLDVKNDGFYHYDKGEFNTDTERQYATLEVTAGEQYRLYTVLRSPVIPAVLFYGADGSYLGYEELGTGSWGKLENYMITVPNEAVKMIVQSSYNEDTVKMKLEKVHPKNTLPNFYKKDEIDNIVEEIKVEVDESLSPESENPVMNKSLWFALDEIETQLTGIDTNKESIDNLESMAFVGVRQEDETTIVFDGLRDLKMHTISVASKDYVDNNALRNLWQGKTLLTYGDSITAYGNGNGTDKGWQRYVCENLGFSAHYGRGIGAQTYIYNKKPWVANADGTLNKRDNGGTVIDSTSYTDSNGNVVTVSGGLSVHYGYFASWDRIKTMIPDSIKDTIDVIFMFGVNDAWKVENVTFEPPAFTVGATKDEFWANAEENTLGGDFDITTFVGAVASAIMKLQVRCPNALIVMGTTWSGRCLEGTENTAEYEAIGKLQWKEGQIVKEIANYFSIPCVDIWGNSGVNQLNRSKYNEDNVHPNSSEGYKALARTVIGGFRGICPKL